MGERWQISSLSWILRYFSKAKQGNSIDCICYLYLYHFQWLSLYWRLFALILVDRATRYNWTFGLWSLSSDCILAAICLFRVTACSLAPCFYCDCDAKLFGTAISEYLIDNNSKIISAPVKRQSYNGLVESHLKVMVLLACAYLIEKQMPHTFLVLCHHSRCLYDECHLG